MKLDKNNALYKESEKLDIPIIPHNSLDFAYQDFIKSGISKSIIDDYISKGYLTGNSESWSLSYPDLSTNQKTSYATIRLKNPKDSKYIRPKDEASRLFKPYHLASTVLSDTREYIIITEGEKKAVKAVQEGFNCIALGGVWCWKTKPKTDSDIIQNPFDMYMEEDIITDIKGIDFKNKVVILCFDSDIWYKEGVKLALYSFAGYLIKERGAIVKIAMLPNGKDKGLDDFLLNQGKQAFQKILDNSTLIGLKDIQNALQDKKDLNLNFPIEVFNDSIKTQLKNLSAKMDAPIEYFASAFIGCLAILMNTKYSLVVDKSTNRTEHPVLWTAIVGGASNKKTPCINIFKNIISDIEMEEYNIYLKEVEEYKQNLEVYELAKRKKCGKNSTITENLMPPKMPLKRVLTVQDTTVEGLVKLQQSNQYKGIAILVDELASFFNGLGQYKKGGGNDFEYFLQAWKRQKYRHSRASQIEDVFITPSHNILGTIQPTVLNKTIFKDGVETTNGMIERWLFACTNYSETGELKDDIAFDKKVFVDIYTNIFKVKQEKCFTLSKEANELCKNFNKQIVIQKKSASITELMKSYLQKQTDYVLRLALILHCIDTPNKPEIEAETLKNAIKISRYFIDSFKNVNCDSLDKNSYALENKALNYLITKECREITPSKLHSSNRSLYRTNEIAKSVLENLARKGYGRLAKTNNNGRKFISYYE